MARIKHQDAAGLGKKLGRPPAGPAPYRPDLVRLYIKEARSVRDVAEAMGFLKDTIHRALKKFGIKARANIKRSRLRKHGYKALKAETKKKGIRGAARDLGVNASTLSRFFRSETKK